jgi:hypothetical protein
MHAEQLQDDRIWDLVKEFLSRWGQRGRRWTLFVQPLRARAEGVDLRPRLDWLRDNGHEVALHTHFYRLSHLPGTPPRFEKTGDLSPDSVLRCLDEDYDYLVEAGHKPRGFVAGAWVVHEAVPRWLATHAFRYDSTRRSFSLRYDNPDAVAGDDHRSIESSDGLIHVPTTATLRSIAMHRAWKRQALALDSETSYEMFYLHDYDLARPRARLALTLVNTIARADAVLTAGELADAAAHDLSES